MSYYIIRYFNSLKLLMGAEIYIRWIKFSASYIQVQQITVPSKNNLLKQIRHLWPEVCGSYVSNKFYGLKSVIR
jgi:hypothetical protein